VKNIKSGHCYSSGNIIYYLTQEVKAFVHKITYPHTYIHTVAMVTHYYLLASNRTSAITDSMRVANIRTPFLIRYSVTMKCCCQLFHFG